MKVRLAEWKNLSMADSILTGEAENEATFLWLHREYDAAAQTLERLESTLTGQDKADPKA